jgi:exo-beta-1,3-glucanase (GH17 family)
MKKHFVKPSLKKKRSLYTICLFLTLSPLAIQACRMAAPGLSKADEAWATQLTELTWVDYSPTMADPDNGVESSIDSMTQDLVLLRKAHFTGLVTYSSAGNLGRELPRIAKVQGFQAIIIGVWDPNSKAEVNAAIAAAADPIVLGICVGNEGLDKNRYDFETLRSVVLQIRAATRKPVTTTEITEQYSNKELTELGDWVFPNAHPYFHKKLDPDEAANWTVTVYRALRKQTTRPLILKEVGLPTAGSAGEPLSEFAQDRYYTKLKVMSDIRFVYFEAFDQYWKKHLPVEPHWGLFKIDRAPKLLACHLMRDQACGAETKSAPLEQTKPLEQIKPSGTAFYVYLDYGQPFVNHFKPSGLMGDTGDLRIDENWTINPRSGKSSIHVSYNPQGKGPYGGCNPPCNWAGVYWQQPPDNWGNDEQFKGKGFNLSDYKFLKFYARADQPIQIEFRVGGLGRDKCCGDSLKYPRTVPATLTPTWTEFQIDLRNADLHYVIGGFAFSISKDDYPSGASFDLDDIRFEMK